MDAYLIVDPDSRNITIPEVESAFGVYGDNNAERKYFKAPRIVGNGIDLTECYLYVNYISASTKIGQILCDVGDAPNGTATEDEIVFSWPITRNVLDKNVSGEIFFAVQAKTKTGDTVFTTRKAKGNCYESIEGTEAVAEEYADIVLQLISRMDNVEANIGEQVAAYFKENPAVTLDYLEESLQPVKDDMTYYNKRPIGKAARCVTFIDDDCKTESYNALLPLMREFKIPWGLACPVAQLDTDGYMTTDQLKEMIAAGATVLSHHQKQYAMNQFQNRTEYENELSKTDAAFKAIGLEPKGICYPNGICVDDYMDIVKKHYEYGFAVDRGVNDIPLESLFLKRVEVFPTSEIYTLDDVKKYVDALKDGEWLIFMTHAWYTTFDSAKLTELINYVKSKNVDIVSVDEGMSRVGNLEEHGIIRKPLEYMSTPFFCVDKTGVIHTNNQKFYQKSDEKLTNVTPGWNAGYNLTVNGATPAASSKSRLVSAKATVVAGETYLISASNIYGNALYCIYDASDAVIAYEASENTADGTIITKKRVTIPENASYMKIASNIATQPGGYEMLKVEKVAVDYDFVPADRKDVSQIKEDLIKTDDTTRILFLSDNTGWKGENVGDTISTSIYSGLKGVPLLNALKGDVFYLKTNSVGGWAKSYFILDANKTIIEIGSDVYDGLLTINNDSARYLAVNTSESNINDFVLYLNTKTREQLNENTININKTNNEIDAIKTELALKATASYIKNENITNAKSGIFNINTKEIDFQSSDRYKHTVIENINIGDVYYCTGVSHNNGSDYPFIVFTDSNDNVLSTTKSEIKDYKYTDYKIIVDNTKCSKIYVNGSVEYIGAFTSKKIEIDSLNQLVTENSINLDNNTWFDINVQNAVIDEQKKNPFAWGTLDKGCVVFTFDDTLDDIDLLEELSEEYSVPICFAAIPERMNATTTATGDNKTVAEVLTQAVQHGNEVLCHSGKALSSTSTDDEVYAQFVTNKKELESYGFVIRGIIEAGSGGGEKTFNYKRAERYLRLLYNYSDYYGTGLGLPNFDNNRTYINRDVERNHKLVDDCATNKSILIFVTHSITDNSTNAYSTSENILRDLFQYVKTKNINLLTFGNLYDSFRSSQLENKINVLKQ